MTDILLLEKDFLIVRKPAGIPTQPDPSGDKDLVTFTAETLRTRGEADGLYLIHRLDRTVGGLVVLARTPHGAKRLSELVRDRKITKEYLAVTDGIPAPEGKLFDYLYKDAAKGKSYAVSSERRGTKPAELTYRRLAEGEGKALVAVRLLTGRHHQIRVQFSSRGMPLAGDKKYGSRDNCPVALYAAHLSFSYDGRTVELVDLPRTEEYPWCLFSERLTPNVFCLAEGDL